MVYLFDDLFIVNQLDPGGKKFDKVYRIVAQSQKLGVSIDLDVSTDMFTVQVGEKFKMTLASTLNLDGTPVTNFPSKGKSIMDKFEYVMYGKLYKISEDGSERVLHASFGGLLLELKGDSSNLTKFKHDQNIFLLISKA